MLEAKKKDNYIVSLTTFPARINKVWIVIESILRQKIKPDRIILWLYRGEFDNKESLPQSLLKLEKRGLEIRFCDENLKPHKKYFYSLLEYPKANIITIDDDFIYPPDLVKNLIDSHMVFPNAIICSMSREIGLSVNGELLPYHQWRRLTINTPPSIKNLTMGGGGTLLPPNSLHSEVLNLKNLKRLALNADDLWLKIMSLKRKSKVVSIEGYYPRPFFSINIENNIKLAEVNLKEGQNDLIFKELMAFYQLHISMFKS